MIFFIIMLVNYGPSSTIRNCIYYLIIFVLIVWFFVTADPLQNKFSYLLLFQAACDKKRWLHDEDCDLVKYLVAIGMIWHCF